MLAPNCRKLGIYIRPHQKPRVERRPTTHIASTYVVFRTIIKTQLRRLRPPNQGSLSPRLKVGASNSSRPRVLLEVGSVSGPQFLEDMCWCCKDSKLGVIHGAPWFELDQALLPGARSHEPFPADSAAGPHVQQGHLGTGLSSLRPSEKE